MTPVAPDEREPILDALRGFAILGILLVNIEVMRGPEWLLLLGGGSVAHANTADRIAGFAVGWLGTGKFLSSLAILFGIGAALIAARALQGGRSPRGLLARRYACLALFGLAHMPLFPGDILFLYGVTGFALLPFVRLRARSVLLWAIAIFAAFAWSAGGILLTTSAYAEAASPDAVHEGAGTLAAMALNVFGSGSWADILSTQASLARLLQEAQLTAFPWVLSLFLFGYAIARAGIVADLGAHRKMLARGAAIGLAVGLPLNFGLGFDGPLSGWGEPAPGQPPWITIWGDLAQVFGEPVLAVGYLCALSLIWLQRGAMQPLAAVGRMALTAYILESALGLCIFGGLRLYGRLTPSASLVVVAVIWIAVLVFCRAWLRRYRIGPVEWLWRSLTYGRLQPMR